MEKTLKIKWWKHFSVQWLALSILLAFFSFFLVETSFAAIQLNDDLRPDNLPTFDIIDEEDTPDPENPETRATFTLILFVGNLVSQVLVFAGAVSMIFIIVAGINYVFAFGKDERIGNAKRGIYWALMGLITIIMSYAIVQGIVRIALLLDAEA